MDDTLIPNAYSYYVPQLDATKIICLDLMWAAPNPVIIINRACEIQIKDIAKKGGISKECFPMSFIEVYKELCEASSLTPNVAVISAIFDSAQRFFLKEYTVFDNVKETLTKIKLKKIIVTRGDFDIQDYKVDSTRLHNFVDAVEIVRLKSAQTYTDLINKFNLIPEETAMVGDSINNDIIPALEAGLYAFHVNKHQDDWETIHVPSTKKKISGKYTRKVISITTFSEILPHLDT